MGKKANSDVLSKLLLDRRPERDAFRHIKISDAIFEFIIDEQEGGKAIALSGGFGSGKSAVIDFLRRRFEEENKKKIEETKIFTFDAWEHQGDPLRRAFIEEYVEFFENHEWVNEEEFDDELDKIAKRREEIETTSEPVVSKQGGIFAFLLLLIPLGMSLVRYGTMDKNLIWMNILGFLFILSPIIYVLGLLVRYDKKERKSVFNLFFKKTKENIKSKSFKTPEPTTIEFQDVFNKITSRALGKNNRRLIVVIDNIDRLTSESSIKAWTTLRTFFENENKKWTWKDKFWLITPFDFQELKKLWTGLAHLNNKNEDSESTSDYVQAFIDKTFQITFRVPRPVLSDWKSYFKDQLRKAFPRIDNEKLLNDITTIYQLKGFKGVDSPTPRDIKQFLNRVGATYRIWHEEIKLPVIAYYELVADVEHLAIVKRLQKGDLIDPTFKSLIGEDKLNRKLVAIHFNCEIDKAYQVLFGDEIATALQEGKAENLEEYFETEGFRDVLDSEFYTIKSSVTAQSLTNCAICLYEIENNSEHEFNNYFYQLSISFLDINSFKPLNESIGKGIIIIWRKIGFSEEWITSLLTSISKVDLDEEDNTIEEWVSLISPIFEKISEKGVEQLIEKNISIPGGATDYIKVLAYLNKLDENEKRNIAKYIQPNVNQDQIVTAYSSLLNSDELPYDLGGALYLESLNEENIEPSDWNWDDLVNQIKTKIQINVNTGIEKIEASLKMMLVLCYKFKIDSAIQLSKDQNFQHGLFYLINNQSDESELGILILSSILFNPNNQKTVNDNNVNRGLNTLTNVISSPEAKKFIEKDLLNYLIEIRLLKDFLEIQHGNDSLQSLSEFIIKNAFEIERARKLIKTDTVFKYFDVFYKSVDNNSLSDHIEMLYDHEENLVEKITTEFDTVPSSYREHYYFAKSCPDESREHYFEFLAEGFENLEKDDWFKHLKDETELIDLVILVQQSGLDLNLSVDFKDALEDHYRQIYMGEIDLPRENLISDWISLLDTLDEDIKNAFLKNIKFYIESNTDGMVANIGYLYDSILISEKIYLTETHRLISTVFTRVLKTDNEKELEWLKELIQQQPEIMGQDDSATKAFKAEIKHIKLENYSSNSQEIILEIANLLQVPIDDELDENSD